YMSKRFWRVTFLPLLVRMTESVRSFVPLLVLAVLDCGKVFALV
ncbi:hypothetical protein TNIN_92241, partial [Trichonephila inaurata madagascariensis]